MSTLKRHLICLAIALIIMIIINQLMLQYMFSYFYNRPMGLNSLIYPADAIGSTIEFLKDRTKYGDTGENVAIMTVLGFWITYCVALYFTRMFLSKRVDDRHGSASFMQPDEVEKLGLLQATDQIIDGRPCITIGGFDNAGGIKAYRKNNPRGDRHLIIKPLSHYGIQNILLVAPPGGGKGIGVVRPNLVNYQGSMVINDNKGVEYQATARTRAINQGNICMKFEPASSNSIQINPLDVIPLGSPNEFTKAMRVAELFTGDDAVKAATNDHFKINGVSLLAAVILHVLYTRKNCAFSDILSFLSSIDPDTDKPFRSVKHWLGELCGSIPVPKDGFNKAVTKVDDNNVKLLSHLAGFAKKKELLKHRHAKSLVI